MDFHSSTGDGVDAERIPTSVETALYRITQETLTNIVKHAQATKVSVVLEHRAGQVQLIVEDNGVGFDCETERGQQHLGLIGIQERSQMVGGTVLIESSPGAGTSVFVRVPLS